MRLLLAPILRRKESVLSISAFMPSAACAGEKQRACAVLPHEYWSRAHRSWLHKSKNLWRNCLGPGCASPAPTIPSYPAGVGHLAGEGASHSPGI